MRLLSWLARLFLLMLIIRMVARAFSGSGPRSQPAPRPGPRPAPPSGERTGGTLVRDPQCGTYLPQTRAIRVGSGDDALYFCSAACRDAYRASHPSVA
jgi:uncharacterized protein